MSFTKQDLAYMKIALEEAEQATAHGDIPVGAVLVDRTTGEIIARGRNTRERDGTALGHAEIDAIAKGCEQIGGWRLADCTLYVTLEPCPMCAGAILSARIPRIVFGAHDPVAGAMGSIWALHSHPVSTNHTTVEHGCLETECRDVLQRFFRERRQNPVDGT